MTETKTGMKVKLIGHTPEPEKSVATAAMVCYSHLGIDGVIDLADKKDIGAFIDNVVSMGHLSVLEHASFMFGIEGASRALTHQLVRHRLASFSQQSQRYVDGVPDAVVPDTVASDSVAMYAFEKALDACREAYETMTGCGVPPEDARYILPNASKTTIVVTMNARELRHFFSLRCCNRAQWEIRDMAMMMLELCQDAAPSLFRNAGPACLRGRCPEGRMSCGKPIAG